MDWKDALAGLDLPAGPEEPAEEQPVASAAPQWPKAAGKLNVAMERKGRGGKTATIIYGFGDDYPQEALEEIASLLKRKLGIGGSARGGEILLQGDRRQQALACLRDLGFKA